MDVVSYRISKNKKLEELLNYFKVRMYISKQN